MSIRTSVVVIASFVASVASAEPDVSLPWQLRSVTTGNAVDADTTAAVFRDHQGNVDLADTTRLSASYQLTDHWAPTIRLGFAGNNAPGAALDGGSFANPIAGVTYTPSVGSRRLALFAALAIPIGSGGGNDADPRAATSNAAAMTARPTDEAMFEVDYATVIAGADVAYVKRGVTVQIEATLSQSARVRGDMTPAAADAFRTRAAVGTHVGMFLGEHVSVGVDLDYRRWLSHPAMLEDEDATTLTAALGVRVHVQLGRASIHPGLAYMRGLDGYALRGPLDITKQTNAVAITIPVRF